MTRRSRGEGGITKRANGHWQGSWVGGDGKTHTLQAPTRREASERLTLAVRQEQRGGSRQSVGEYLAEWLAGADHVKAVTHRRYASLITHHTGPIAAIELRHLRSADLAALYAALKGRLAPATIGQLHAVLHSAFDQAVAWELISRNPAHGVKTPRVERMRGQFPTVAEIHAVLDAVRGDWYEHLYTLAVHTGARQGELLGLRWCDVDLDGRTISINGTLVPGRERTSPKTRASVRTIPLTGPASEALRGQRRQMTPLLQLTKRLPAGDVYVFLTPLAELVNGYHLTEREFKPLLIRAGLPVMTFHALRHVAATLMLSNGVPVHVVSRILGHASPSVTLDVYAHVIPGDEVAAVAAIERALAG